MTNVAMVFPTYLRHWYQIQMRSIEWCCLTHPYATFSKRVSHDLLETLEILHGWQWPRPSSRVLEVQNSWFLDFDRPVKRERERCREIKVEKQTILSIVIRASWKNWQSLIRLNAKPYPLVNWLSSFHTHQTNSICEGIARLNSKCWCAVASARSLPILKHIILSWTHRSLWSAPMGTY